MGAMDARPVSAGFEGEVFGVTGRGLASPLAGPAPSTGGRSSRPDSGRWLSEVEALEALELEQGGGFEGDRGHLGLDEAGLGLPGPGEEGFNPFGASWHAPAPPAEEEAGEPSGPYLVELPGPAGGPADESDAEEGGEEGEGIPLELLLRSGSKGQARQRKDESTSDFMERLTHMTLDNKGITRISNMGLCRNIRVLYLYNNRIRRLANLQVLQHLTHLYVQGNELTTLNGIGCLPNLLKLYADGNRLRAVSGLYDCIALEELHIGAQRLAPGEALTFEPACMQCLGESLRVLIANKCRVGDPTPLAYLALAEKIDITDNHIIDVKDLEVVAGGCQNLRELCVEGNPVARVRKFRENIIASGERLQLIDNHRVTDREREFILRLKIRALKRTP